MAFKANLASRIEFPVFAFRRKSIGLGNGQKHSKEFGDFVLATRKVLREEYKICERGCQRVLLYSNNFLHKRLKTENVSFALSAMSVGKTPKEHCSTVVGPVVCVNITCVNPRIRKALREILCVSTHWQQSLDLTSRYILLGRASGALGRNRELHSGSDQLNKTESLCFLWLQFNCRVEQTRSKTSEGRLKAIVGMHREKCCPNLCCFVSRPTLCRKCRVKSSYLVSSLDRCSREILTPTSCTTAKQLHCTVSRLFGVFPLLLLRCA